MSMASVMFLVGVETTSTMSVQATTAHDVMWNGLLHQQSTWSPSRNGMEEPKKFMSWSFWFGDSPCLWCSLAWPTSWMDWSFAVSISLSLSFSPSIFPGGFERANENLFELQMKPKKSLLFASKKREREEITTNQDRRGLIKSSRSSHWTREIIIVFLKRDERASRRWTERLTRKTPLKSAFTSTIENNLPTRGNEHLKRNKTMVHTGLTVDQWTGWQWHHVLVHLALTHSLEQSSFLNTLNDIQHSRRFLSFMHQNKSGFPHSSVQSRISIPTVHRAR